MCESVRRHAVAWLCAVVCWLVALPALAEGGRPTSAKLVVIDVPAEVLALCAVSEGGVKADLGCDKTYWREPEVARKGISGAPLLAFKSPGTKGICDVVAELNSPSPSVEIAPPAQRLLRACGYAENPARKAEKACAALSKAIGEKQAEVNRLGAARGAADPQAAARAAAESAIAALQSTRTAIGCGGDNDQRKWDKPMKELPICKNLEKVKPLLSGSEQANVVQLCVSGTRAGAASAAAFLTPLVQGLGDFLQSRGKEELIDFAVEQLGRKFCAPNAAKPLNGQALFHETCHVLFPKDGGDADIDAVVSGRFQKALSRDLSNLPVKLLEVHGVSFGSADEVQQIRVVFEDVVRGLVAAPPRGDRALDFLVELEKTIRDHLKKAKVGPDEKDLTPKCRFEKGQPEPPVACGMMLLFTAGAQAKGVLEADGDTLIAESGKWIERTAEAFCKSYGAAGLTDGGKCLGGGLGSMSADLYAEIRDAHQAILDFHNDLVTVMQAVHDAPGQGKPSVEAIAAAASGISGAMRRLTDALTTSSRKHLSGKDQADLDRFQQIVDLTDEVLKGVAAATKQDFKAVAASLRIALDSPLVAPNLSPQFKEGMFFVFDVAEAKDRDDMRKVFEQHAAPLGSYKAKYKASTTRLTLNGYVGFFSGARGAVVTNSVNPRKLAPELAYYQLSGPVGLDISGPAFDGKHHLGVTLVAIDPLAVRVTQEKGQSMQVDLEGVLAPGAYFRWGIYKSPITLMLGFRVQPLLRSVEETCGASGDKPCWRSPITGLAGIAVDVPIVGLN